MTPNDTIIAITNLHKTFGENKVLDGVELTVNKGKMWSFLVGLVQVNRL
jgi:ABC-type histidine transport system ATPase subunit